MSDKTDDREDAGMRTQTAQAVRDLWSEIKKSKRVVIFCGAGVTIGHTGVSWGELVRQVGRKTLCTEEDQKDFCIACENFFGSTSFTAEQKASVAAAKVQDDTTINEVIAKTLYKNSGYQQGRLLIALTNLIMEMLIEHIDIDIVTTNYDTYIEESIFNIIDVYKNNEIKKLPEERCPRMNVIILKDDGSEEEIPIHDGGGSTVNFVYVHGRVDRDGAVLGTVVFSERDYEKSHNRTTKKLMKLFENSPTIIVGSSLVDTPLIRSLLGLARAESKGGGVDYHRYAVMARVLERNEDSNELQVLRAEQLGLKPLFYDYYGEIPDIFWNLHAFLLKGVEDFEEDLPCELAKNDWVKKAEERSRERTISTQVYEYSAHFVRVIRKNFAIEDEYLKIEFWFLEGDDGQTRRRFLKVWTNSAGPVYTRGLRRCEEITSENAERVASVRSFIDGGVNLKPLDELNIGNAGTGGCGDTDSSRWKTFFSVPINYRFEEYGVEVTVGIVTLASMHWIAGSKVTSFCEKITEDRNSSVDRGKLSRKLSFLSPQNDELKEALRDSLMALGQYAAVLIASDGEDVEEPTSDREK
mgnify:CR=1 FL=1